MPGDGSGGQAAGAGRRLVLATLFFAATSVVMLRPLPWRAATHVAEWCDTYLNTWILAWVTHALGTPGRRLFDANIHHPLRGTLALSDHMLGVQPVFAPVYLATGNPVLAMNVMVLVSFVACGVTMTVLAFALTRRFAPSLVAGFVWAFVPYRIAQLAHVQLLSFQWLPLALLLGDRLLRRGGRGTWAAFVAVTLWQCLAAYYLAYATAAVLATYAAVVALRMRRRGERPRVAAVAGALVVVAVAMLPVTTPYARMQRKGVIPRQNTEAFVAAHPESVALADPVRSWVTVPKLPPSPWTAILTAQSRYLDWEKTLFPGLLPVVLALGGGTVWLLARARGAAPESPPCVGDAVCGLLAVMAVSWILSLGPWLSWNDHRTSVRLPAYWLAAAVPGLSGIRAWSRFGHGVAFGLAPLAALGLARLVGRRRVLGGVVAVAVLAGLGVEYAHAPIPVVPAPVEPTPGHAWLAAHGAGQPLFVLPTGAVPACQHARYMLQTTAHWLPLASGYSGHQPPSMQPINTIGQALPAPEALRRARRRGFRWLLVELDGVSPAQRAALEAAEAEGRLVVAARFPTEVVYDLRAGAVPGPS